MGWLELLGWAKAMNDQQRGPETSPDSWKNSDQDPWWREQRAARDRERAA